MKVWITKYALTDGILEGEALEKHCVLGFGITKSQTEYFCRSKNGDQYLDIGDFCFTYELAIQKAEEMRQKKIESLKNQIEKLEEMRFE